MTGANVILFVVVLLGYAGAFNLYLIAFLDRNQKLTLYGSRVLWSVWLIHTAQLAARWVESGHAPLATRFEALSFYGWGLTLLYLLVEARTGYRAVGTFATPVVLALLGAATFMPKETEPLSQALQSGWLPVHVSVSFLGYAALTLAAGGGASYLLQERQLKAKRPLALYYWLPPLQATDELINALVMIGLPLITLSLITGALWAQQDWGALWSFDPKQNMSLVTWVVYLAYFYTRHVADWRGRKAAWLVLGGFLLILATYLGSGLLGATLHAGDFAGPK